MNISYSHFAPDECISLAESSLFACGRSYGKAVSPIVKKTVDELKSMHNARELEINAHALYTSMCDLAHSSAFIIDGVNRLQRYLDFFHGFTEGAGVNIDECAMIQSDFATGCQTVIIQPNHSSRVLFWHFEENLDDTMLRSLYKNYSDRYEELFSPQACSSYLYRVVTVEEPQSRMTFFGYPGMGWNGSAMSVNHRTNTICFADYLSTIPNHTTHALWANAVTAMVLDIGEISLIKQLITNIQQLGIGFFGSYAVHVIQQGNSPQVFSFEFGDTIMMPQQYDKLSDRTILYQSNIPKTSPLLLLDEMNIIQNPTKSVHTIQLALELQHRNKRLRERARSFICSEMESPDHIMNRIYEEIVFPFGDIETNKYGKEYTGYETPLVAACAFGYIEKNISSVILQKLNPKPLPQNPYHIWYDEHRDAHASYTGVDLLKEAQEYAKT
jgi:hypothetical protein